MLRGLPEHEQQLTILQADQIGGMHVPITVVVNDAVMEAVAAQQIAVSLRGQDLGLFPQQSHVVTDGLDFSPQFLQRSGEHVAAVLDHKPTVVPANERQ
jgi:hypothetical protein